MRTNRRRFLQMMFTSAGVIGLRSLVTGLPVPFLLDPRAAAAAELPTFLILSVAREGDPLNANCPGSYVSGVSHPSDPEMQETPVTLGSVATSAAKPWSTLDAELRGRLAFLHHRNGTAAHTELENLLRGHGSIRSEQGNGIEMLPSAISLETSAALATRQVEPLSVGPERMSFQGRWLDNPSPSKIKALFSGSAAVDSALATLRDSTLDAIYGQVKASGSPLQKDYLNRWAMSREQAKSLGNSLGSLMLSTDEDYIDGAVDQITTAVVMLGLGLSPVVTVHIPFGGDNHQDPGLALEAQQTNEGVAALGELWRQLKAAGLQDRTTFATLNTFGRSLKGTNGRAHNGNHHVMAMFGPRVQPGVYGGVVPVDSDFGASAIDSRSGQAKPDGDIAVGDTLLAAVATLATAVGVPADRLAVRIPGARRLLSATR